MERIFKKCSKCKEEKPIEHFYVDRKNRGYQGYCKACALENIKNHKKKKREENK